MLTCGTSGAPDSTAVPSGACAIWPSLLKVLLVSEIAICADRGAANRKRNARVQHPHWFNILPPRHRTRPPRKGTSACRHSMPPSFLVNLNLSFARHYNSGTSARRPCSSMIWSLLDSCRNDGPGVYRGGGLPCRRRRLPRKFQSLPARSHEHTSKRVFPYSREPRRERRNSTESRLKCFDNRGK